MFASHPAKHALATLGAFAAPQKPAAKPLLDGASPTNEEKKGIVLDAAETFLGADIRMAVAAGIQQWAETEAADLDEGETMADRLFALMVGIADDNKDGELTDEEAALISVALENAFDYLVGKGVAEADALALLEDNSDEAAGRVLEFIKGALPQGEDESMDDVDAFAFDAESSESLFDAVLDAVYKKKLVVRGGRKVRIMKRVSGRVVLSAGQKVAIRKARRKAHSSSAKMRRAKSMKMRARSGL